MPNRLIIKSKDMYMVAKILLPMTAFAERPVDMNCGTVFVDIESCCTTQCFAGWYLLAKSWSKRTKRLYLERDKWVTRRAAEGFTEGARLLDRDLGLIGLKNYNSEITEDLLPLWAQKNPKLWGNENGVFAYSDKKAFGKGHNEDLTLKEICDHLFAVADRIKQQENNDAIWANCADGWIDSEEDL